MSTIRSDIIIDRLGTGAPNFSNGIKINNTEVGLLSQTQVEDPTSTIFGAVSGQRVGQSINANFNVSGSAPKYACRAWVNFDGKATVVTIRGSGNVSSVTRNATGDYTINFTTAMPDANYSVTTNAHDIVYNRQSNSQPKYDGLLTTSVTIWTGNTVNASPDINMSLVTVAVFR